MVRAQQAGAFGTAAETRAADGTRARRLSRLPLLAVPRLTLPALLAMALAGCAGGEGLDGAFGAQDTGVARTGGTSAGVVNSATTGALVVGTGPDAVTYDCPPVTVRTGAGSWQVTAGGGLRYQGTLGRLARECSISGGTMMVRVGIEGRILMGEKGTPGQVKVPIRIAVVQEGPSPKNITTKFFNVAVDVPADPGHAAFTVVEEQIAFPLLKPAEMERHVIYVGFDPQGTEAKERKPAPAAKPKPRPKPAADTSEAPAAKKPAATQKPASSGGAPQGDVFGPPPGSSGTLTPAPSTGGFEAPPSTSTFSPPPR
ncbi:hypothetical protein [Xanthobacter versatilis]|uniref:hypothetical protein n=1 Tax=Xanthobacter autotrophicus (strain ATCC BAA-1158 / Py2) TaxID=78245 RepID=UPI0037262349